jgi:tocopherol O-methyltransferase
VAHWSGLLNRRVYKSTHAGSNPVSSANLFMTAKKISKKEIISYYDSTEADYKLVWDLGNSYAMHFGYWDEKVKNFPQSLERENEILAIKAKIKSSDIVLDAGCGIGGSSIYLAKHFGCKVVGITLSKRQAYKATNNAKQNGVAHLTEFRVMDFEKMTFARGKFDVVWAIESVCHADSKKQFIKEAYRVLRKGGRLIIADAFMTKENITADEEIILNKFLSGWGVNYLETEKNFNLFLRTSGYRNITFTDVTDNVMPSSKRLYRFSILAMYVGKFAELFKIRTKTQTGNIIAAHYQHKALIRGLGKYGIFYAEKP